MNKLGSNMNAGVLPVRPQAQKEMRNMSLETGGKGDTQWQKKKPPKNPQNLRIVCPAVLWEAELINNELEYLAEEISKQRVEGYGLVSCHLW